MGCAPVWVKIYIFETRARVREAFNSNTVDSKMKTLYFKFTIPHSRLATMQHLANSEKNDELAGADPPQKTNSDVYAVTAGVKGGSFPPLKNLGISMSSSALSLHLRTDFHHILFNSSFVILEHLHTRTRFLSTKNEFLVKK